jgi:hypothetical protein
MKKFILLGVMLLLFVPLGGQAQESAKSSWRKTGDHWARKNSLTFTASTFGFSGYNGLSIPTFNLEYDRAVLGNMSVSATGIYSNFRYGASTDSYTMNEIFVFAGAKVNYNLPVVRNWLYFRAGLGAGVGVHKSTDVFGGELYRGPSIALDTYIKPHVMVDMYLVFRAARWLELRFAPLLISPSQFLFGSTFDKPYNNTTYFYLNAFGTLGVTVRF